MLSSKGLPPDKPCWLTPRDNENVEFIKLVWALQVPLPYILSPHKKRDTRVSKNHAHYSKNPCSYCSASACELAYFPLLRSSSRANWLIPSLITIWPLGPSCLALPVVCLYRLTLEKQPVPGGFVFVWLPYERLHSAHKFVLLVELLLSCILADGAPRVVSKKNLLGFVIVNPTCRCNR